MTNRPISQNPFRSGSEWRSNPITHSLGPRKVCLVGDWFYTLAHRENGDTLQSLFVSKDDCSTWKKACDLIFCPTGVISFYLLPCSNSVVFLFVSADHYLEVYKSTDGCYSFMFVSRFEIPILDFQFQECIQTPRGFFYIPDDRGDCLLSRDFGMNWTSELGSDLVPGTIVSFGEKLYASKVIALEPQLVSSTNDGFTFEEEPVHHSFDQIKRDSTFNRLIGLSGFDLFELSEGYSWKKLANLKKPLQEAMKMTPYANELTIDPTMDLHLYVYPKGVIRVVARPRSNSSRTRDENDILLAWDFSISSEPDWAGITNATDTLVETLTPCFPADLIRAHLAPFIFV